MVLPFLSDSDEELGRMVKTAKDYGEATSSLERNPNSEETVRLQNTLLRIPGKPPPELLPGYESLFGGSFQPPREYQRMLEEKVREACRKHKVKYVIA